MDYPGEITASIVPPMRILLCHNYYRLRGGEDLCFEQEADLLTEHGHEVHRYVLHNDQIDENRPARAALTAVWNSVAHSAVRAKIREIRPCVVHFTNTFPLMSPSAIHAAHGEGVPVVQALHNYRLMCAKALFMRDSRPCELCLTSFPWHAVRYACYRDNRAVTTVTVASQLFHRWLGTWRNKVDLFYTMTEFARSKFIAGGLRPERIVVKPNFARQPTSLPSRKAGAVFVGRLSTEKGIETLLKAWKLIRADIRLTIIGDGPLADQVHAHAAADSRIRWLGERPTDEVQATLSQSAVLVMPSICYEVLSRVILESYALATPVLASRLGTMAEVVRDGVTGRLFAAGDPHDLATAVTEVLGNEPQRAALGQAARNEYEAKYTPQRNHELLMELYARAQVLRQERQPGWS